MDRGVSGGHGCRQAVDACADRPGHASGKEHPPDALVLECVGDGDGDFSSVRTVRLEAEVADDSIDTDPIAADNRHKALLVIVIRRAERS